MNLQSKHVRLDPDASIVQDDPEPIKKKHGKRIFASKKQQELPLQKPFPLPNNFSSNIEDGLKTKHLVGKSRSKFVTRIAEAIFCHKSYPTTEEYRHVVKMMFDKWPFLKTAGEVSLEDLSYNNRFQHF